MMKYLENYWVQVVSKYDMKVTTVLIIIITRYWIYSWKCIDLNIFFRWLEHWLIPPTHFKGPSWSWSNGSWNYNYMYSQCLSPLKLWVWTHSWRGVLDTTLCDKVCQCLLSDLWQVNDFLQVLQFPPQINLTVKI
jgi:hypothetical protein